MWISLICDVASDTTKKLSVRDFKVENMADNTDAIYILRNIPQFAFKFFKEKIKKFLYITIMYDHLLFITIQSYSICIPCYIFHSVYQEENEKHSSFLWCWHFENVIVYKEIMKTHITWKNTLTFCSEIDMSSLASSVKKLRGKIQLLISNWRLQRSKLSRQFGLQARVWNKFIFQLSISSFMLF